MRPFILFHNLKNYIQKKGSKKGKTGSSHKHKKLVEYAIIATQVSISRIYGRRRSELNLERIKPSTYGIKF